MISTNLTKRILIIFTAIALLGVGLYIIFGYGKIVSKLTDESKLYVDNVIVDKEVKVRPGQYYISVMKTPRYEKYYKTVDVGLLSNVEIGEQELREIDLVETVQTASSDIEGLRLSSFEVTNPEWYEDDTWVVGMLSENGGKGHVVLHFVDNKWQIVYLAGFSPESDRFKLPNSIVNYIAKNGLDLN